MNESGLELGLRLRESKGSEGYRVAFRAAGLSFAAAVLLWIAALGYGRYRTHEIAELDAHPRKTIQAGVIQANIGDFDKVAAEQGLRGAADSVLATYTSLSDQALELTPKPDFILWPETAYPSTFGTPYSSDDLDRDLRIQRFVASRQVPLLFGGYDRANGKDFNAFFLLSPSTDPNSNPDALDHPLGNLQVYRKNILLMFGEYVPGTENLPIFKRYFPQIGNFGRGVGPEVLKIPIRRDGKNVDTVKIGPIICYEALFSDYVIDAADKGSDMILNITNDSWFGPWGEPELHLALTTFRSIETKLPQLRSTNTGISGLILPDGTITHASTINKQEVLNITIPIIDSPPTLMKAWGDWFGKTAFAVGLVGLLSFLWLFRLQPQLGELEAELQDRSRQLAKQ